VEKKRLLIVDDEEAILKQLKWAFKKDYRIETASTLEEAQNSIRQHKPALITLDLSLSNDPGRLEGFQILEEALAHNPAVKVIVITGHDDKENAVRAVEQGAYDFYTKPVSIEELKVILKRAARYYDLEQEINTLRRQEGSGSHFSGMIANSLVMAEVFGTVSKVAPTDIPVLITGESGTGKELIARALHDISPRRKKPFVPINCGAIPENLLESELFGHKKGSFTSAHADKPGKFEIADGGTIFLDEIGELPSALQVKLLRTLQDQTIEPIGGRGPLKVDVRVLAATNRDLKQQIQTGRFREDLFYRINAITIHLPPLRDREGDLGLLAMYLLHKYNREFSKNVSGFSKKALESIHNHDWPGNIRELENKMKRAVIMGPGKVIQAEDLELAIDRAEGDGDNAVNADSSAKVMGRISMLAPRTLKEAREEAERRVIIGALVRNGGNISNAAQELGVSRPTLHDLMKKLDVNPEDYRPAKGRG
jgi:two-component system NtrC family response regulator